MVGLALPMALAGASELFRFGVGAAQNKAGKEVLENSSRPVDYITNSDKSSLNIAKMLASLRELPGAGAAKERIDATTANAIRESKLGGDVDIATIAKDAMGASNDLSVATSQMINNNLGVLMSSLTRYGGLEKDAFNYNEKMKYEENMNSAANLQNSGLQNMFTGVSNVAAAGIGAHNTSMSVKMIEDLSKLMSNDFAKTSVTEKTGSATPVEEPFNAFGKFAPMGIKNIFGTTAAAPADNVMEKVAAIVKNLPFTLK
jgi:hypothetical protein